MKTYTITEQQYWFYIAARAVFEYENTKTAAGHKREARRLWSKMVRSEAEHRRQIESQDQAA